MAELVELSGQPVQVAVDRAGEEPVVYVSPRPDPRFEALSPREYEVATLVAAGFSNRIRSWSLERQSDAKQFVGHRAAVTDVEFSHDASQIVSASMDHSVRIWNVDLSKESCRLLGHQGPVRCLSLSPSSDQILSGGTDGTIRLWQMPENGH